MRNIHQEIVDRIVESLESGVIPWIRPWKDVRGGGNTMFPHNGNTGRVYGGINVILLWMTGYSDPRWYTYKGALAAGGNVRRGEKGTSVVFFTKIIKKATNPDEKDAEIPLLRGYTVFNAQQCDGIPEMEHVVAPEIPIGSAQSVVDGNGVPVVYGGNRAFYSANLDQIGMPNPDQFVDEGAFWSTLLHEEVHSTGHESRCDRQFGKRFGDNAYAFEELVAEIGSAFLCAHLGIQGSLQHSGYIDHWIKILKGDRWALWTAAKAGERATDYLLRAAGIVVDDTEEAESEVA